MTQTVAHITWITTLVRRLGHDQLLCQQGQNFCIPFLFLVLNHAGKKTEFVLSCFVGRSRYARITDQSVNQKVSIYGTVSESTHKKGTER